jgi:hypothetical protein
MSELELSELISNKRVLDLMLKLLLERLESYEYSIHTSKVLKNDGDLAEMNFLLGRRDALVDVIFTLEEAKGNLDN